MVHVFIDNRPVERMVFPEDQSSKKPSFFNPKCSTHINRPMIAAMISAIINPALKDISISPQPDKEKQVHNPIIAK
jgi:hypothetical protein